MHVFPTLKTKPEARPIPSPMPKWVIRGKSLDAPSPGFRYHFVAAIGAPLFFTISISLAVLAAIVALKLAKVRGSNKAVYNAAQPAIERLVWQVEGLCNAPQKLWAGACAASAYGRVVCTRVGKP